MERLTKVLMDGGNVLNIMYAETLDAMGIDRARIWLTGAPFHVMVPGKQVVPLGQIDLPVTFGDPTNYRRETHTFEVVRVITIDTSFQRGYECEVEYCEHAAAIVASKEHW
ncbi:uncharacterized protein [Miscanthus floridulus]|uniref:uncharacterized protein n=1 Tax=Miscanthus floridulus TaxID=154761 RepID=UPI00345B0460